MARSTKPREPLWESVSFIFRHLGSDQFFRSLLLFVYVSSFLIVVRQHNTGYSKLPEMTPTADKAHERQSPPNPVTADTPENMEFSEQQLLNDPTVGLVDKFVKDATTALFGGENTIIGTKVHRVLTESVPEGVDQPGTASGLGQMALLRVLANIETKLEKTNKLVVELRAELATERSEQARKQGEEHNWRRRIVDDVSFLQSRNNESRHPCSSSSFGRKRHGGDRHYEGRDRQIKERRTETSFVEKFTCTLCMNNRHPTFKCTAYSSVAERQERAREIGMCTTCSHIHSGECRADDSKKKPCPLCQDKHPVWLCPFLSVTNGK